MNESFENTDNLFHNVIAVTNRRICARPFMEQIKRVCSQQPRALILREKDLSPEDYLLLAENVLAICRTYHVPCILHTYAEAAQKLGCQNIHLPLHLLRKSLPHPKDFSLIGTSVHSPEEAAEAEKLGASYVIAGHIYATDCKKGLPPRGTSFLRNVCQTVAIPVYAIGGIHPEPAQIDEVTACGASGVCMMSDMMRL